MRLLGIETVEILYTLAAIDIYPTNLAPICGGGDIQKLQANLTNFPALLTN